MTDKSKKKYTWEEVKELCQLSDETIKMAKELKLTTSQLIKSLEISQDQGKLSVEKWVQNLHKKHSSPKETKIETKPKNKPSNLNNTTSTSKIISFPSIKTSKSEKSEKSKTTTEADTKTIKPNKLNKPDQTEKKLLEIRQIALNIEDDVEELPLKLWDLIQWMVENKKEKLIKEMLLEDEEISDAGVFALDFVLKDIGYRYPLSLATKGKKGKAHEEFELIPFAILILVPVENEKLNLVPTKLLKTIEKLSKDKILRKALLLSESPAIILDPHLYHVDHSEWVEESSIMQYLDGYNAVLSNLSPTISPLTEDYKRPSVATNENLADTPHFCLVMRALCGAILARDEESLEAEEQLFEHADSIDSESKFEARQKAWQKVEETIVKEFEQHGITLPHGIFVNPSAVELWDIPHVSVSLSRILPLQLELHNAIAQLAAEVEDGENFTPMLYVSQHGENENIEEIRLAGYSDPNQDPFFKYVWSINPEFDDPDDVANTVITIASELEAEVIAVEGLKPKDYCSDCGEALFYGPNENQEMLAHNHREEYIN
jgi:hypothetical protein